MARPNVEAERREQILRATCDVLADKGRHALRLTDVAEAAGLSSGIIHYYFTGKKQVLAAAFEYNFRQSLERRRQLLDSDDAPASLLSRLLASYRPTPDTETAWRVWAELWAEAIRDPQLRDVNEALYGEWRDLVTRVISRGQQSGEFRAGDPAVLANVVIATMDGLATQVIVGSTTMTSDHMRDVLDQLVRGFIAVAPAPVASSSRAIGS